MVLGCLRWVRIFALCSEVFSGGIGDSVALFSKYAILCSSFCALRCFSLQFLFPFSPFLFLVGFRWLCGFFLPGVFVFFGQFLLSSTYLFKRTKKTNSKSNKVNSPPMLLLGLAFFVFFIGLRSVLSVSPLLLSASAVCSIGSVAFSSSRLCRLLPLLSSSLCIPASLSFSASSSCDRRYLVCSFSSSFLVLPPYPDFHPIVLSY